MKDKKDRTRDLDERAAKAKDWIDKRIAADAMSQDEIDAKCKRYDATMRHIQDGIRKLVLPDPTDMSDIEKYEHIAVAVGAQISAVAATISMLAKLKVMSPAHAIECIQSAHDLDREVALALVTHAQFETTESLGVTAESLRAFDESKATKQ